MRASLQFVSTPTHRLISAGLLTFLTLLVWPAWAFYEVGHEPRGLHWIMHSVTWTFYHLMLAPLAIGLLASAVTAKTFTPFESGWYNGISIVLLILMVIVSTEMAFLDRKQSTILPINIDNAEVRKRASELEIKLRDNSSENSKKEYAVTVGKLEIKLRDDSSENSKKKYAVTVGKSGSNESNPNIEQNSLEWIGLIVNIIGGCVVSIFVWVLITTALDVSSSTNLDRLFLSYGIFGLWFPCRLYATWYEKHFFDDDWLIHYRALNVILIVYIFTGILFLYMKIRHISLGAKVFALILAISPVLTFSFKLMPKDSLLSGIPKALELLQPVELLAVFISVGSTIIVIACDLTRDSKQSKAEIASKLRRYDRTRSVL